MWIIEPKFSKKSITGLTKVLKWNNFFTDCHIPKLMKFDVYNILSITNNESHNSSDVNWQDLHNFLDVITNKRDYKIECDIETH